MARVYARDAGAAWAILAPSEGAGRGTIGLEGIMTTYLLALAIGIVAGLRAMTAPAAMSWAAHHGALRLGGSWLAFLGNAWTQWILIVAALGELVTDQLPSTPSRTVPVQFGARVASGALSGAAIGVSSGAWAGAALAGALGAVVGTLGGRAARARLAAAFGRDRPAAILEDVVAIGAALLIAVVLL
jgi:uncharacterized membrane protein